jgi:hypothetical protein
MRLGRPWLVSVAAITADRRVGRASQERFARVAHLAPGCFQELGAELALAV